MSLDIGGFVNIRDTILDKYDADIANLAQAQCKIQEELEKIRRDREQFAEDCRELETFLLEHQEF